MPGLVPLLRSGPYVDSVNGPLTRLPVILGVGHQLDGGRHAVRHGEEGRDGGHIPDVAIGEADLAQGLAVGLAHLVRALGELGGEVEEGALARGPLWSAGVYPGRPWQLR